MRDVVPAPLRARAEHNLQIARRLLAEAKHRQSPINADSTDSRRGPGAQDGLQLGGRTEASTMKPRPVNGIASPSERSNETTETTPGSGNLPLALDRDPSEALSPDRARAYLERVAERVQRQQREHRRHLLAQYQQPVFDW
jgi:hypothetical protein